MSGVRRAAVLLTALLIGGCGSGEKEENNVSELTRAMRTYCIGRHLVDLPESFQPSYRASSATLYFGRDENFETVEVQVVAQDVKPEQFEADVERRSAQIAAEKNESTNGPMLLLKERVGTNAVLLRYHKSALSNRSHLHELHVLVSGAQLFLKAESYEGKYEGVEARLKRIASQARWVADPKQAGAGFCFGPLVIDADNDYEVGGLRFRSGDRKHRDLRLSVDLSTFKRDDQEPKLIERARANFSAAGFKPHMLREGKAELAGMPAEEWIARHSEDERTEHVFDIEAYPATAALATPVLQLQMETGGAIPSAQAGSGLPPYEPPTESVPKSDEVGSSLSDGEAMAVWRAIVATVRARPGAVKQR